MEQVAALGEPDWGPLRCGMISWPHQASHGLSGRVEGWKSGREEVAGFEVM